METDLGGIKVYPDAGQIEEEIRWTPNPRPQDDARFELSFTSTKRELRPTHGGATYLRIERSAARRRG